MGTTTETRITSTQAKDAIYKAHSISSSASEIDDAVTNHITQAELDAVVLGSGNITPEQATTISNLSGLTTSVADMNLIDSNFKAGKNLYNKATRIDGYYVNSVGLIQANASYSTSAKVYVSANTTYKFSGTINFITYFTSSNTVISAANGVTTITTPANTSYIRFSSSTSIMQGTLQLELGSITTTLEDYQLNIPSSKVINFTSDVETAAINAKFSKLSIMKNLYNKATDTSGYYLNTSGNLATNVIYRVSDYISVLSSTSYVSNKTVAFSSYYNENKVFISSNASNISSFLTPTNAKYIRLSTSADAFDSDFQFEKGTVSSKYVPYKEAYTTKNLDTTNTPTILTASISDSSADFVGRRSVQDAIDSIDNAGPDNRYSIDVWDGVYSATTPAECDKVGGAMKAFIMGKNHVDIVLRDNAYLICKLPNNLGSAFPYVDYQTVLWNVDDAFIYGGTIIGENCRYPIHIDSPVLTKDANQYIYGTKIIHNGNTGDALNWTSWNPIGLGTGSGQNLLVENCIVSSASVHNNANFTKPSITTYKRCSIIGGDSNIIVATSLRSTRKDKLIFEECDIAKGSNVVITTNSLSSILSVQIADRVEVEVEARGNEPIAVTNNTVDGVGLKITSKTTGTNSSVLFDHSSTAFPLIISTGINSVSYKNRYLREVIYGYEKFNGGNELAGYAIGSLDISSGVVASSQYITSLGKRLGDCSTVNKTLTVIIDGTSYNIVFNKNYNGTTSSSPATYTNAQIIAEIAAIIGSVATVEEYVVGKDYYPLFKGNTVKTNADTTEILAGMGVVYNGFGTIRKATNVDGRIDGIALDNCIVGGKTRIITCGQIYSRNSGQRFSIQQSTNTATTYGTKLGMGATAGIFEIGVTPTLLNGVGANIVEMVK